jgi:hypothetical protein
MVLINNLLAQGRFGVVPWLLAVGGLYLLALGGWNERLPGMETFAAFRRILGTLGASNLLLLVVAIVFTSRERVPLAAAGPSV